MTNIYALIDPRTAECRYVGKTNNINKRLKEHVSTYKTATHKSKASPEESAAFRNKISASMKAYWHNKREGVL